VNDLSHRALLEQNDVSVMEPTMMCLSLQRFQTACECSTLVRT
jgi:hypothetical protein